jgi:hypothetical protein
VRPRRRDGFLRAWRKVDGRWSSFVTYSIDVGSNRVGWIDQASIRES